jgi:hypothetical protein
MWFTEDAWSPIVVLAVATIISFIAWYSTQRPRYLAVVGILIFAALMSYFVEQVIVTDSEKVEAELTDLIDTFIAESQAISKLDQAQVIQCERFFSEQNTIDKARVRAALVVVRVENDTRITDVQIRLTNENTRATTHFRANGTVATSTAGGGHFASRWKMTWQKEGGEWKITRTRMLNPMSGEDQQIPRVD